MIGVEVPRPGSLTFQRMFFPSLHVVGGSANGAAPLPSGPRHCGQFDSSPDDVGVSDAAGSAAHAAESPLTMTAAISRTPNADFQCAVGILVSVSWV
jgi:hypothetical protein